jgi:predicted aspartyl protease
MALTHISVRIANPARPKRLAQVKFLVDSGAIYSVVPARTLDRLGVKPHSRRTFVLADSSEVMRRMGDAAFRLNGRQGASPGVLLDPLRRELRPLPMVLAPRIPG